MKDDRYRKFRQDIYEMSGIGRDSVFDLMDSIMTTKTANGLGDFYLSQFYRRGWSSVYEGIQDSRLNEKREEIMERYIEEIPKELEYVVLVIDHTSWQMAEAKTVKDRGYYYNGSAGVIKGQGYSTIGWVPEEKGSWIIPLRNERITSFDTAQSQGKAQLKKVCEKIKGKILVLLDSEYGNGNFLKETEGIEVSLLMRTRSNICLYREPASQKGRGRPRKHGEKFKLNDSSSQREADEIIEINDEKQGLLRISKWQNLHFKTAAERKLSLIKVERLNQKKTGRYSRPLWLIWVGEEFIPLEAIWSHYAKRFKIEHWYRFAKQRLHWTLPRFGTVEQYERWSDLMPLMTWQLWLARDLVQDHHLPWQKPQINLTPERVAQSIFAILVEIGSPSPPPKTRGKSSGWEKGRKRDKRKVYPLVKKRVSSSHHLKKKQI